ncbi:MAG: hypothetical protein J5659_04480 [Clostridia bacterium]|nr:hypothetical protein [Clostridia bacterium]
MKKIITVLLVLVIACLAFAACGKSGEKADADPAKAVIGTWEQGSYVYVFEDGGKGSYNGAKFTYEIKDNKISILYDGNTAPFETEFAINGDELNIKDSFGNDTIYKKK